MGEKIYLPQPPVIASRWPFFLAFWLGKRITPGVYLWRGKYWISKVDIVEEEGDVCSTCGATNNKFCSNSFHVQARS